jgi:hypothetical protein
MADELRVLADGPNAAPVDFLESVSLRTEGLGDISIVGEATIPAVTVKIEPIGPVAMVGHPLRLRFRTEIGRFYQLETRPTLGGPAAWTPVPGSGIIGDGSMETLTLPLGPNPQGFYRLRVE